jgi:hypothetical protein
MRISEIKEQLTNLKMSLLCYQTEVLSRTFSRNWRDWLKNFIDCGGKVRNETVVNFQLWNANDFEHRLKPKKT